MEKIQDTPEVRIWSKIWIVRISDVGEDFAKWLQGQTLPLVEEDEKPTDWAYYHDYARYMQGLTIID